MKQARVAAQEKFALTFPGGLFAQTGAFYSEIMDWYRHPRPDVYSLWPSASQGPEGDMPLQLQMKRSSRSPSLNDFGIECAVTDLKERMTMRQAIGDFLLRRLQEAGMKHIFGVPGDYNLGLMQQLEDRGEPAWIGNCNELNASYATDGYARINGLGALSVTYGVGALERDEWHRRRIQRTRTGDLAFVAPFHCEPFNVET